MAQDGGTGIVQHHTADMEHTADHIDGVFRAVEMFLQLDRFAIGVQHLDIPPRVHINLLNAGSEDVLGEQAELGHLRVEGVHQLVAGIAFDRDAPVLHIFGDVPFDLGLGVFIAASVMRAEYLPEIYSCTSCRTVLKSCLHSPG